MVVLLRIRELAQRCFPRQNQPVACCLSSFLVLMYIPPNLYFLKVVKVYELVYYCVRYPLLLWLLLKVSSSIYDDSEQVRLQAARLLWQLGNLLGTK